MKPQRFAFVLKHWLMLSLFCCALPPELFAARARPVVIQAVHFVAEEDALVVSLEVDGIAAFTPSTLPNPPRVIIDIRNAIQTIRTLSRADEQIIINIGDGGVARARIGQMGTIVRIVFDVVRLGRYQVERQGTTLLIRFPRAATQRATRPQTQNPKEMRPEVNIPISSSIASGAPPATTVTDKSSPPTTAALPSTPPSLQGHPMPELKLAENTVSAKDGKKNFNLGMKYEARQQWDVAVQHFIVAVAAEPTNPEYQLHLLRAKQNAAIMLSGRGDALTEQHDYNSALRAYRQAAAYDETNELVHVKMQRVAEQQTANGALNYNPRTGNIHAAHADIALPSRTPSRDLLQVIHFENARLRQVLEKFGTDLGLNVLFDESFKDEEKFRFKVQNVTLARAFDMILVQTKHLFEQVDRRTILIYADTPTHRQRFEQLLVKTFYLGSADANDVKATLHQMIGAQRQIAVIKQLNALIVRDTVANLKMIQEMIDSIDKNRAEVVVDVDIYEVSRSTSLEIGNQLALGGMPVTETRFDKDGRPISVTTGNSASLGNLGGVGRSGIAAIAGNTVAPVLGGVGTLLGLPPSSLSLLQSKGNSKLLASTQIHALDGEQNQTKVGRSVPVRLGSTFVPGIANAGTAGGAIGGLLGGGAFDSIQYRDVGLVIDVTPTVSNEGYVQLRMKLESTNVEASGADLTLTPSFTQRSLSTIARVSDNKTAVVAGIKQESKGESRAGIPVLSMIPLLGRFVTTPRENGNLSDIIITVTPHILRAPELRKEDHLAKLSGTFVAGVTQSIEDLALRAQSEDDQERRITNRQSLIAQGSDNESSASPANTAAQATTTSTPDVTRPISQPATLPAQSNEAVPIATGGSAVDLSLIPSAIEAESGASFFVVASVYGDAKMNEAKLSISFDPVLLQFKSVRSGGLFGRAPKLNHQVTDGELKISLRQVEDRDAPIAANGQLVLIEFVALHQGETFIEFLRDATELRLGRNAVQFNPINAQVLIGKEATTRSNHK